MRIFYAAGASPNAYHISESNLWKNNLFDSLVEMGHEVIAFGKDVTWHFTHYQHYQTSAEEQKKFLKYKADLQAQLVREITACHLEKKIDLFFSYFWSEICGPETIEKIKAMGIKTVNWFCNGSYQFHLVAELAPHYDFCLVPEKFRLNDYLAVGARPIYCQEAANPTIYKSYDVPIEFDVTFVGQAYGDRPAFVKHLLGQGIDVRVWGSGWQNLASDNTHEANQSVLPHTFQPTIRMARQLLTSGGWQIVGRRLGRVQDGRLSNKGTNNQLATALPAAVVGRTLSDLEMIQTYSRSRINLGFSSCGDTHRTKERILQVRLRDFEVPMSGGFYMVEYMDELEDFFEIGKEIVCYTGAQDLADKIKHYLHHDGEREAIRRAGHERCLRDHTWQKRFEMAFKEMELSQCVESPVL